jgi:hypothetical protein
MTIASHTVEALSPEAFASLARSLFPCAPRYSRNRVPPGGRDLRPSGVNALSCETRRWPLSLFLGKHGSVFTLGPSLRNPYTIQLTRCYLSILAQGKKSGKRKMSLPAFIHPRQIRSGLSEKDSVIIPAVSRNKV